MQTNSSIWKKFGYADTVPAPEIILIIDLMIGEIKRTIFVHCAQDIALLDATACVRCSEQVVELLVMKNGLVAHMAGGGVGESTEAAVMVMEVHLC